MTMMTSTDRGMMMNTGNAVQGMPQGMMMNPGMLMVPRCTMKMEKTADGMKIICECADKASAVMMQNLCNMMANGMMSCCMMMNGQTCCQCNMSMGICRVEMMDMGCCFTCTSGDAMCRKMIHCMCDCMMGMMMPGCSMYMMMNGSPVCCMVC